MNNTKILKNKRIIIPALALLLVLVVGIFTFKYVVSSKRQEQKNVDQSSNIDAINFDPPTEEDRQAVDENKQRIVDQENALQPAPDPVTGKKAVTPIITYAGVYGDSVEVGAFIDSVIEDNGKCTLILTKDSKTKVAEVAGTSNVSSTDCSVMSVPTNELERGTWNATVKYTSVGSEGVSEKRTVEVK